MSFSSIPVEVKIRVVGFLVGIAHVVGGLAAWQEPSSLAVTQLAAFHKTAIWFGFSSIGAGAILFSAGVMAIIGSGKGVPAWARSILLLPQQVLMTFILVGVYGVFIAGTYPDGYRPGGGGWFILQDQFIVWVCSLSHTLWLTAFIWEGLADARIARST